MSKKTTTECKTCDSLTALTSVERQRVNEALLSRDVSAEFIANLLTKYSAKVSPTTVKKHRKERHIV